MRKIRWHLETGFPGANHDGEIVVDDAATEEEIDEAVKEEVFNCISWGWAEVKGGAGNG